MAVAIAVVAAGSQWPVWLLAAVGEAEVARWPVAVAIAVVAAGSQWPVWLLAAVGSGNGCARQ